MRPIITMLTIWLITSTASPQSSDEAISVSYLYSHPVQTMRSADADVTNQYILLTDGTRSKFYSPKTEFIDSIESTPEGFEQFNTIKRICYEKKQADQIPRVDGSFYITTTDDNIRTYDIASATKFHFDEPLRPIIWTISDSTKTILGYECVKATAHTHGREWTGWFAPEIPIRQGPWKLHGLPGLILEANSEGYQYNFIANRIERSKNPQFKVYGADKWEPIKREEFWQLRRSCLENPSRSTQGANAIVFKNKTYSQYLPKEIVDYIETDY